MTGDTLSTGFETLYQATVEAAGISTVSRGTANKVIDRLLQAKLDVRGADLTKRIQEAAGAGDIDQIFKLTNELRQAKDEEKDRSNKLAKLAEEFTFIELLNAFSNDYRDLVYELGMLVIEQTEEGLAKSRKRPKAATTPRPRRLPIYVISKDGRSIEAQKNPGAPRYPADEREFFEFLGFKINPDGRSVTPATFVNVQGEEVRAASKKAVIDDMLAGGNAWKQKGYTISEKPQQPSPAT